MAPKLSCNDQYFDINKTLSECVYCERSPLGSKVRPVVNECFRNMNTVCLSVSSASSVNPHPDVPAKVSWGFHPFQKQR